MNDILLTEISTKQDRVIKDVADLNDKIDKFPCTENTFKINQISKIVNGAVKLVLMAFMASVIVAAGWGGYKSIKSSMAAPSKPPAATGPPRPVAI